MKKLSIVALVAIVAAAFTACGNGTPKANLKSEVDTLSYALGVSHSVGVKDYLVQRQGVDTAYINDFIKGMNDGINAGDDKKKAAYYAGVQIGQNIANQMVVNINRELFGNDTTQTISLKNYMAGFVSGTTDKNQKMTVQEAQKLMEQKMHEIKARSMMKEYGDNKKAGEDFLAKNKQAEGVKTLANGVQYKVLKEGNGELAKDTSMVRLHYEGRLIDGTVFDSSYKRGEPITTRANKFIPGFTEALLNMPAGSTWEVYIPQDQAYAERMQGNIKPFSALVFKIELLDVNAKTNER